VTPADLEDAAEYLGAAGPEEHAAFAARQLSARRRLYLLRSFYGSCRCRMARIHLLTGAAVVLGRFCGFSATFDAIGAALMPVTDTGAPRTPAWSHYRAACDARKPRDLRDELWIAAHVEDMEHVRAAGLDRAFYAEADRHEGNPTWRLLREHMQMTLDARLIDHSALAGAVAYETAVAQGMSLALKRIATGGRRLLSSYADETKRALVRPTIPTRPGLCGDRETAFALLASSVTAWSAASVYRRGVRAARRGMQAAEADAWPLLASVLGSRVGEVAPLIVDFYSNPARFRLKAALELHTLPARFWSFVVTKLVGQGLYETHPEMEGRFRVFRREDGSMHFVRELHCGDELRVFDSDFVVRNGAGGPRLFEVFPDQGVDVELDVRPSGEGGLVIRCQRVYLRGLRLPNAPIRVEFRTREVVDDAGRASLEIDGLLLMQPETAWGRWLAYRALRRPEELGRIRYRAWPG
jgi:Domain of unknown function (DUF4166)